MSRAEDSAGVRVCVARAKGRGMAMPIKRWNFGGRAEEGGCLGPSCENRWMEWGGESTAVDVVRAAVLRLGLGEGVEVVQAAA